MYDLLILHQHFNSQPHKEADVEFAKKLAELRISTHSLTRRLTRRKRTVLCRFWFQLTASQGGWLMYSSLVYSIRSFQLTASQGGWRSIRHTCSNEQHFNSQPHKEADTFVCHLHSCWTGISTHSLTRRLTFLIAVIFFSISISTHSLTRRLTQKVWCSKQSITHFNSQPHKEADQNSFWRIQNCWQRQTCRIRQKARRIA